MGESAAPVAIDTEAAMAAYAGDVARRWRDSGCIPLLVGLKGELGAGKTTWVRAALRALGYPGRVPSPTFTLLEQYDIEPGKLTVVHVDLYRLASPDELEHIGLRDWLTARDVWLFVEWPERAPALAKSCDLLLEFGFGPGEARQLGWSAGSPAGVAALAALYEGDSK